MRFVVASLLFFCSAPSYAQDLYTLTHVYDGDTVELKSESGKFKLRLTDIDAPERNQEYGQIARRALSKLCKGSDVSIHVEIVGKDKYDRYLGKLQCNQTDASLYMAENGYAWFNAKYSDNAAIRNAAAMARKKRLGLWNTSNPSPPWVWRHLHGNAYQSAR